MQPNPARRGHGHPRGADQDRRPRLIDPGTAAVLRAWKRERGSLALPLPRDDALLDRDIDGRHRQPEHFSRTWLQTVSWAIREGVDVPSIRLHDLRHTHAPVLLSAHEPVSLVSERLGHASEVVTVTVYSRVMPGDQERRQPVRGDGHRGHKYQTSIRRGSDLGNWCPRGA
jgi:integrase